MGNLCEKYQFLNRQLIEIKQYIANNSTSNIQTKGNSVDYQKNEEIVSTDPPLKNKNLRKGVKFFIM